MGGNERSTEEQLLEALDEAHAQVGSVQRRLFRLIVELGRRESWAAEGARDAAHLLSMRYGLSTWKATGGSAPRTHSSDFLYWPRPWSGARSE